MLNPIYPFLSQEDIFYSLRCSDSKSSASSFHSLALKASHRKGDRRLLLLLCKGISRVSPPPPPQTGACQEFTHHFYHKAELVLVLLTGPASACVSLLNLYLLFPLAAENRTFILSKFLVHDKLPQDARGSFSTRRNVPAILAHILPWEWSLQGGEGVPCHFLNGLHTNRFFNCNQLKKS